MIKENFWIGASIWTERLLLLSKAALSVLVLISVPFIITLIVHSSSAATALDKNASDIGTFVDKDPRGIKGTFANLNAILLQVGEASDEFRRASVKQSAYLDTTSQGLTQSVENLNKVLTNTNDVMTKLGHATETLDSTVLALKDGTVPQSTATLAELQRTLVEVSKDSRELTDESTKAIKETETTVANVNDIIADGDVKKSISNMAALTGNLNQSGANVAATTGYIKDMFKPSKVPFWKELVESWIPLGLGHLIPTRTVITNTPTVILKQP